MGLLDSVIGSLSSASSAAQSPPGGLGSLLTGLGGGGNAGLQGPLLQAVVSMLASDAPGGGLPALVRQFQEGGLGDVMASWVSTGPNQAVSPEALGRVLGSDHLDDLARQFGVSHGDLLGPLSQLLPQVVDRLTPDGQLPSGGLGPMAGLLKGLVRG